MKIKIKTISSFSVAILSLSITMGISTVFQNFKSHKIIAETKNNMYLKQNETQPNKKSNQLFPYLSEEKNEILDKQLTKLLGHQKIKTFFYEIKDRKTTTLTLDEIKNLTSIEIITDKNIHFNLPVKKLSEEKISILSDSVIIEQSELSKNSDENVAYLTKYINNTSMEELEAVYDGPMTYLKLFNGDNSYSLMNVQIGDNKEIDSFQLKGKYEEIQNNSSEVANFIISSFPELENRTELEKNINEILFTYTYLQRWYDYSIGGIKVSDLMFSKQNIFSKTNNNNTNYEHLINFSKKLKSQPWASGNPGMPYAYSIFTTFPLFEGTDSLRNEGKGFDSDDLLNSNGEIHMSSIIEYLIRTLENTEDYNAWFEKQGFVTATSYLPDNIGASNTGKPLWEALKSLEKNPGNRLSQGFITNLLSVSDKSKISISNSAKGLFFSNTIKQINETNETPKELAQKYTENNNSFFKFILQVGTEEQKNILNDVLLNESYWYTMDAGEFEGKTKSYPPLLLNDSLSKTKSFEGLKDFYNTDNVYLNQFILSADIKGANALSNPGINGVTVSGRGQTAIYLSLNSLNSEFTISHEETHRMQKLLNGGYNLRGSLEVTASLSEVSNNYGRDCVNLNYFYENSKFKDWNVNIPKSENDLEHYAKNMMDLNYAWNISKAKIIFEKNISDQVGKVYQAEYNRENNSQVIKKLNKSDLEKLDIHTTDSDFIDKLVKNKIVLPADTTEQEISYGLDSGYATIPFERDSLFYFINSGEGDFKEDKHYINGYANLWAMEFMGNDGMQGYVDFFTDHLGKTDSEVINQKFGQNATDYLIERYKEVSNKIEKNQLKDFDSESLNKLVESSIDNDRDSRRNFLIQEITNHDSLFESIYKNSNIGGNITVKYIDSNNQEISQSIELKGNVDDEYSTDKKIINGYTLKEIQGNVSGKFTAYPQIVAYIYTKNKKLAADATVKYVDENGKSIHTNQVISGVVGDAFDTTTAQYQLAISGYTLDKAKLPSNAKGQLSDKAQTIVYTYKKNVAPTNYVKIFRVYNKNTGEHLYTTSAFERDSLVKGGWSNEGTGWSAPDKGTAVYRVYNPNAKGGDHYYTSSKFEAESLIKSGWKWDNNGKAIFYSGGKTPVYVAYNPNAQSGSHNYTQSSYEQKSLLNNGWKFGSTAFYGK